MSTISSQGTNRAELAEQYTTAKAEKEELASEHEADMNHLKKSFNTEKADLQDRFESSIQADKLTLYDNLRRTKQQGAREERDFESATKHAINQSATQLKREEISTEQEGRAHVTAAIQKYAAAEEYERNKGLAAETIVRTDHKKNAEHIIQDSQKRLNDLAEEKTQYLENAKEGHSVALGEIRDHYEDARAGTVKQYNSESALLQQRANEALNSRRLAAITTVEKFDQKKEDPFYQIKRFDSDLLDMGTSYMLRVKVPQYERGQFKVSVAGQEIQLHGVRTSDEKVKLEEGREVASRSYQNISERYSLDSPVDGKSMTFREAGDWVEYTIPKFGANHKLSDQFRHPQNMQEDETIGRELTFKDTLPTATPRRKDPSGTMT
jgi:hypothetical protein